MKQFKAEWLFNRTPETETYNERGTIDHIITQHNAFVDYVEGGNVNNPLAQRNPPHNWDLTDRNHCLPEQPKTITLPKPNWWKEDWGQVSGYLEALSDASKASGITFKIED